jgi:hypothetical protein
MTSVIVDRSFSYPNIIINLHISITIQYLIQLKSYFEVSTILTFIYTEIYLSYFLSIVHNNHSVKISIF